jgi:hypothetical protein
MDITTSYKKDLLLAGQYYDVAVRDGVMAIGAFSLYIMLEK